MNLPHRRCGWLLAGALGLGLASPFAAAFPPAPHHTIVGLIRDELGNPVSTRAAEVAFETTAGITLKAAIVPGLRPGVNYKILVPMDSGLTDVLYKPTALHPAAPFKLRVRIGAKVFLPLEMAADYARLGQPGEETRLDLTLGEDSDGDGLPDAWERALAVRSGGQLGLDQINPGDDLDADGLSNLNEYLAGTYAYDAQDGFTLKIAEAQGTRSVLEFVTVRCRAYSILGSTDMEHWIPVAFRLAGDPVEGGTRETLQATQVTLVRASVDSLEGGATSRFFKVKVQ